MGDPSGNPLLEIEPDRGRVARDLHNVVAQAMSMMVIQAAGVRRVVATDPDRATRGLRAIEATGRDALGEMRRLLPMLRPPGEPALLAPPNRVLAARVEDPNQVARELHDGVAHSLSEMVIQAGGAARLSAGDLARAEDAALMIETTGRRALTELRRLLGVLRRGDEELALAPTPSIARVDRLVARTRDAGLRVELRIEGEPVPLATVVDLAAYRIVQEALTNTMQHSGSAHARVIVRYEEDEVEVEVSDTGAGPHPGDGDGRDGHGLIGMRERVALVGGRLEVGRRRDGGFAVRARLPREPVTA